MTELTEQAALEQQKAEREAAEKQDAGIRKLVRLQAEENERRSFEQKMQNIGSLSNGEFAQLTRKWGF